MPKQRPRNPSARATPAAELQQRTARRILIAILGATADGDFDRVRVLLEEVLALPPTEEDQDPAITAALHMLCDELARQAAGLWSDLAGPLSLDPLADRFLPLVREARGSHAADLRAALEYLGAFRLSAGAKARITVQLARTRPTELASSEAITDDARAERIVRLQARMIELTALDPTIAEPEHRRSAD